MQSNVDYWSYYDWSGCFHWSALQETKSSKYAIASNKHGKY